MSTDRTDAVTFEVIRNRLVAITEEMRIALQSVSGSPTVTEA
jgi:N-methylhydantoinase B